MRDDTEDERIYLFGFSRGAYAVRALAGMIAKFEPLPWQEQPRPEGLTLLSMAEQSCRRRLVNQLRGLLSEFGVVTGQGLSRLRRRLPELAENADNGLPDGLRRVLAEEHAELLWLDERIECSDRHSAARARADERARRLMELPGTGPLTALRLIAVCGDGAAWDNGPVLGANPAFAPCQHSSRGGRCA